MKTTLGTANYEYFFDSFFILANRRLSSILVLVALSVSVRPLTCARIRSLGNDLHFSPTMNQHWISSLNEINRRYVWIVRSSRINLSSTNVSSISNDKRSLLDLTDHCLVLFNQCFSLASHPLLKSINWIKEKILDDTFFWINLNKSVNDRRIDELFDDDREALFNFNRKKRRRVHTSFTLSHLFPSSSFVISPVIPFISSLSRLISFSFLSLALGHRSSIKHDAFHSLVAVPSHPIPSHPIPSLPSLSH